MSAVDSGEGSCCSSTEPNESPPFALHASSVDTLVVNSLQLDIASYPNVEYANPSVTKTQTYPPHSKHHSNFALSTIPIFNSDRPPDLASSILSSTSNEDISHASSIYEKIPTLGPGDSFSSQYLDEAASLLIPMQLYGEKSHVYQSQTNWNENNSMNRCLSIIQPGIESEADSFSSMGFSQLMQNADNTRETPSTNTNIERGRPKLTTLVEEKERVTQSDSSFHSTRSSMANSRKGGDSTNVFLDRMPAISSTSLSSDRQSTYITSSQALSFENVRMRSDGAHVQQIDPVSFEVSVDLLSQVATQDVMEVAGNASSLRLWCDSIPSLIITKNSESARNDFNHKGHSQVLRERAEYDGEWIEATVPGLVSPPSITSCIYATSVAVWNCVGFPSYGKVSMFIERQKGRVGLSIGPFPGNITVSHTLIVNKSSEPSRKTTLVDRVQLTQGSSGSELQCELLRCLESCFLPKLKAYMEQTLSSMVRLRALVESSRETPLLSNGDITITSLRFANNFEKMVLPREDADDKKKRELETPLLGHGP